MFLRPPGDVDHIHGPRDVRAAVTDIYTDAFLFLLAHFTVSFPSCLVQRRGIGSPSSFLRGAAGSWVTGTSTPMVARALRALTSSAPTPSSSGPLPKASPINCVKNRIGM